MSPANRTYFPVYDLLEMEMDDDDDDEKISTNDATKASYSTYSNVHNHNQNYNHHNHNHRKHHHPQPHHQHEKKTNRWNMYPFNDIDSHRHQQHKSKHVTTGNEWIQHFQRSNESKPKLRRRHEKRWNRNHRQFIGVTDQSTSKLHADLEIQSARIHELANNTEDVPIHWPVKKEAIMEGDVILGGLMMVHSREDSMMCGPIMPQGGIQALEAMLYTLDRINEDLHLLPNITIGAHILDDCDRDSYGLEMAVDFIKGMSHIRTFFTLTFIHFY